MIKGVHSVIIWTEDLPGLTAFYRDTIGFNAEGEFEGFVIFRSSAGGQLALGAHSEVKGASRDPNRMMIDLTVDDCKAEHTRLAAAGVRFVREPSVDQEGGPMIATFVDPDGNTLQLFQMP